MIHTFIETTNAQKWAIDAQWATDGRPPSPLFRCFLGEWDFNFFVKLLLSLLLHLNSPFAPRPPLSSDQKHQWWGKHSRYTKLLRTSGKRNKPQQTNKKSFSDCVTLDPGESHFLASKDCLQSLPWYAHVDILRSLDALVFFVCLYFLFFLCFVNLFKTWNKDLY